MSGFSVTEVATVEFELAEPLARAVSAGAPKVVRDSCATTSLEAGFRLKLATAPGGGELGGRIVWLFFS
ncbi:MAG: hypothetical protein WB758_00045, partial [Candidatus Sulfotelmatobacter sp.]